MGKKVLLGILDWGLGHATRSSVIIREVIKQGHTPLVLTSGEALHWIKSEFPGIKTFSLPPLGMKYFSLPGALISAAWYAPRLFWIMRCEKQWVEKIVLEEKVDLIVSDNRYGCHHSKVRSVLVCHFLNIVLPGRWKIISPILNFFYRWFFRAFDEIWVPDDEGGRLSGKLSKIFLQSNRVKFIGPLSRFGPIDLKKEKSYDVTAIISGPEPLKSHFAEKIFSALSGFPGRCLVVVGGNKLHCQPDRKIELRYNVSTTELKEIIHETNLVVSRSGYSSIMDYDRLQCRVLLVPTPGQPEQVYLASLMFNRRYATYVDQDKLNSGIIRSAMTSGFMFAGSSFPTTLETRIQESLH